MQENEVKNQELDVRVYYSGLTRKEKSRFLKYLTVRYDYNARTMTAKLARGKLSMRRDEKENIIRTIESGAWRQ